MTRTKMGVSVRTELVDEVDLLVDECADLGAIAPRSLKRSSQHICKEMKRE